MLELKYDLAPQEQKYNLILESPKHIFLIHRIIGAKLGQNHMQHAMLIPEIHEFSMLVKMRQRARSLDAFSHLYRDFQYRLISTYTFSESSCHSESNDMRQGYVLINRLGCRAP